jgi:hypothetical protein
MADINFETERLAELQAEVNRQMKDYGEVSKTTQTQFTDATMKAKFGLKEFTKAADKGGQAVGHLAKAGTEAAKAMYANQKGASAFNSSLDAMSSAATAAGVALMLLGGPVKIAIGIIGLLAGSALKFTKTINEQSDALYKGFQDLSRSGGAASDGMTGLFGDIQKLGLGFQDLESFTRLIGDSSRDLANFSGSVFRGRQEFAKIGKEMEPFRQGLFNAGMTQEQVNEGTMAYLSLQTRLGRSQSMTVNQLADGANKYLVEMDALTKLTGASRKEIEDQRKEAMIEEQFRAKLRQMELSGDKEGAERLRKYNDLMTAINPALGKGIRALSTGNMAADEAQRLFLTSSGQAAVDLEKVIAGTLPMGEAADRTTAAIGQFSDGIGVNVALLKANDQAYMSFADQQDIRIAREKGFSETLEKINKDQINQGVTGKTAADKAQQQQTEMRLNQQKSMLALQRMVNIGVEPATTAMSYFAKVVANVSLGLEKFMNRFGIGPDRELTEAEIKANAELKKHQDEIYKLELKRLGTRTHADRQLIDEEIKGARQKAKAAAGVARQTKKQAEADYDAGKAGGSTTGAAQEAAAATGASGAPAGATTMSQSGLAEAGLKLRPSGGDIQKDNAVISPKLIALAKKIQESIPDFGYFSGFNDKFHHTLDYASKHTQGMALDFALQRKPSKEQGEEIVGDIKSMGANKVLDEYNKPSGNSTGGHIHVEIPKFADGGIAQGPKSGYPAELHGTEAVIPLKNGAVPVSLDMKNVMQPSPVSLDIKNAMQPGGIGPTFAGMNEYTGYNQGPMTTDLTAIKSIAAKLGAYDAATKMITDPTTWKQILSSGIATNYNLGMAEIGTKLLPGIGADIGDRIQELKSTGGADTAAAIKQVTEEFKTAMLEAVRNMGGGDPAVAAGQLSALTQLVQEQRNSNDIQKKMLQAAAN